MKKVIVIGGGITGLSAGIYLKLNDYDVEILEKNMESGRFSAQRICHSDKKIYY